MVLHINLVNDLFEILGQSSTLACSPMLLLLSTKKLNYNHGFVNNLQTKDIIHPQAAC